MSKRTNEELADALGAIKRSHVVDPTSNIPMILDEASEALRAMPEGEQIEGVTFLDGDAFCPEPKCQLSRTFVPHCEHEPREEYHLDSEEHFATLTIHTRKEPKP